MFEVSHSSSQAEVDKHLEMGRDFLSRGQLQDALSHYHAAVEGDPDNYLTHFKRATVYLALGKSKFALKDLDRVLQLKPDFTAARMQRGIVHLKQAQMDEAATDFTNVLADDSNNEEAYRTLQKIEPTREEIQLAKAFIRGSDHTAAIELLTKVIETCPWSSELRELRAESHVAIGDMSAAISDIRSTTKLQSDNTVGYFKLAKLYYMRGEASESLKEVRECLKLDPEHKDCFPHYKKVKKVAKQLTDAEEAVNRKDYKACIDAATKVLKTEPGVLMIQFLAREKLCHCFLHDDQLPLSLESCNLALELNKDPRVYCDRAEAYILTEMFDDAIRDFQDALSLDENFGRAKEGLQRAQKLQKQSEKRDYYKILGVSRNANKKDIVKAYRKAAQKWHPDNFRGEEKKIAEKKFIDVAAAKEVLTDPEKRQQFDRGEDPLDPESQQGGQGFNPFQHQHFHNSPFQFKFHFN
uniref:J domain-containing protein n=2 Tax=Timema TaxID=61471 RepID=A0A7R9ASY1_TIMSH|nr:unnamed protein product [Timema shepardi]CAD7571624.1 unnamed protein product [Timema californicum]